MKQYTGPELFSAIPSQYIDVTIYSFRRNLSYMGMAFSRPGRLLAGLLGETSLLYGIVPVLVSEILYTSFGWWNYFREPLFGWSLNPIAGAFTLSRRQVLLIQAAIHPLVGLVDIFLFAALVLGTARLLKASTACLQAWLMFFMFLWGTFSCLAVIVDVAMLYPPFGWDLKNLLFIHHLSVLAGIAYLLEFIHRKSAMERWKAALITLSGYIVVLASRVIFIP